MPRLGTLAAALLVAAGLAGAPLRAQSINVQLLDPPVTPAAPTSDRTVAARVRVFACSDIPIAPVRIDHVVELRYRNDNCPVIPLSFDRTVDLGTLPFGDYVLRVVEVGDPAHPRVDDEASFHVEASPCDPNLPTFAPAHPSLCLQGDRFRVEADWQLPDGGAHGEAQPVPITRDSGAFWFFAAGNRELMVKVIDACAVNERFWFYATGLTDVGVTLKVTDSLLGTVRTYTRPPGEPFAPIGDTQGLPCSYTTR